MKKPILLVILIALFFNSVVKSQTLKTGGKLPSIKYSECLNRKLSGDYFKNKTLILDFWATWCGPCVTGLPHFNELAKKYANDSVLFISFTNDKIENVKKFLQNHEMSSICLVDAENQTWNGFGITSLPTGAIIDKTGIIKWVGSTADLTTANISTYLQKNTIPKTMEEKGIAVEKRKQEIMQKIESLQNNNTYLFSTTKLNTSKKTFITWNLDNEDSAQRYLYVINVPLIDFVTLNMNSYDSIRTRVINPEKGNFNIEVSYSAPKDLFKSHEDNIVNNLAVIYNFSYKKIMEHTKCNELMVVDSVPLNNAKQENDEEGGVFGEKDVLSIQNYTLEDISSEIEFNMHEIFVLKNEILGNYNMKLDASSKEKLIESLHKYGLGLIETEKDIEMFEMEFH